MSGGTATVAAAAVLLAALILLSPLLLIVHRRRLARASARRRRMAETLRLRTRELDAGVVRRNREAFLDAFIELRQALDGGQERILAILAQIEAMGLAAPYVRLLRSRSAARRCRAAVRLGYFASEETFRALLSAFRAERRGVVRFYIATALVLRGDPRAAADLVDSLRGASASYRQRVTPLLCLFGGPLAARLRDLLADGDPAIRALAIHFASLHPSQELRRFLLGLCREEPAWGVQAARALAVQYPEDLADDFFLRHGEPSIARIAVEAVSRLPGDGNLERLLSLVRAPSAGSAGSAAAGFASHGIAEMTRHSPALLSRVLSEFLAAGEGPTRSRLADVLSFRVDYFIMKLLGGDREDAKRILTEILRCGKYSDAIAFLNGNRSPEIGNELLSVFRAVLPERADLAAACRLYMNEGSLRKLGLERAAFQRARREEKREPGKTAALAVLLGLLAACIPAVLFLRYGVFTPGAGPIREILKPFVVDFNRFFAFYSLAVNSLYLLLLLFSFAGVRRQAAAWGLKKAHFLFQRGMLPTVSIIAPAYCEQATIIESVNSLLNLRYPDYELIVVNDGSSDGTLNALISYFRLEKVDVAVEERLPTRPLRGLYRNPAIPLLTVVDKDNGGKADSLNAGINVSRKEYFCGIDADSLLEPEALLAVASGALDTEKEFVAAGGNILPCNGCLVERGSISRVGIPGSPIARFQTVEYIRAFMAGRVGWAFLDSLLIISGAFGLFRKDRIVEIGGYLTSSGILAKDTVGEDMELVVRLKRSLLERGIPHKVQYAFNANCWTEVPESMGILHRQRDRWHRGLIDILYFHRRMFGNPRYGRIGTAVFPYFLLFEVVGPLVETLGWLMVAAAAVWGLLNPPMVLLLFFATVLMGVGTSVCSLLIAEHDRETFPLRDLAILLAFAVIENFGFRQLVSFWRVVGYFSSMRRPKGWGKMVRKGFAKKSA